MKTIIRILLLVLGTASFADAASMDITTCGQVVPAHVSASLQADLTGCPADAAAINLGEGAKLSLNGFAVASGDVGVLCIQRCKIRGPGEITGTNNGISLFGITNGKMTIKDVDIHDNTEHGIRNEGGVEIGKEPRVKLTNVITRNNGSDGVFLFHGILSGSNVTASNNGFYGLGGLTAFKLKTLTVQHNARDGLFAPYGGGRLINSLLSFNGTPDLDVDLRTHELPVLKNSECGFSADSSTGLPWGVCAGD